MEQHPIPQAITTYEFRLVGEMTLKQFGKLALGFGLAFLFYISPLAFYIKWPLILIFAGLGAALAFVPIQGRPLETWIASFAKAIYSPTEYLYQKLPELPEFLKEPAGTKPDIQPLAKKSTTPTKAKLKEYLGTLPAGKRATAWEQAEKQFLARVESAFEKSPLTTAKGPEPKTKPPARPKKKSVSTVASTSAMKAPPPLTPEKANILSGIIKDKQGRLVEGAIVGIENAQEFPVRTLKSNSLGQFATTLPLENGIYQIVTEKEGLNFDIMKIKLEGKIIRPLEIKAK